MELSNKSGNSTSDNNRKEDCAKKANDEQDKSDEDNKRNVEEKFKIELPIEEELLGSVTTLSSPAVRTSARVIQKMKMDSIRPASPPIVKDNKDDKPIQKTPNQPKGNKVIWTNIERNLFFEAINEFGKDFELIGNYINTKQKRKNAITDPCYKTKEHVRQLYYQTFHKLSKYLRFSDDIKKHAQELYAIINYGEMRRKLVFVKQKDCMKLKELVYKGFVTLRVKGKNIRIKTPSCKALRKLNQLEEWQEEIKLPSKVDVFLKPANIAAWSTVQNLSQNPRIKVILPLQKRVSSLLKTLQARWRSRMARLCEETMILNTVKQPNTDPSKSSQSDVDQQALINQYQEPILCFAPPTDTIIHRPMVNLTEFLSSYSICLNSYEDRIGVSIKGETLCKERLHSLKEIIKTNREKRQRHDSGSEKKSPDLKRLKNEPVAVDTRPSPPSIISKTEELSDDQTKCENTFTAFKIDGISQIGLTQFSENESSGDEHKINGFIHLNDMQMLNGIMSTAAAESSDHSELENEPIPSTSSGITGIHNHSTTVNLIETATTTTTAAAPTTTTKAKRKCVPTKKKDARKESFKTLLNEETIQRIKKGWTITDIGDLTIGDLYIMFGKDFKVNLIYNWIDPKADTVEMETNDLIKLEPKPSYELNNKLKQLLLLARMAERTKRKINCSCDRGFKIKNKSDNLITSYVSNKIYPTSQTDSGVFRQPVLPLRGGMSHMEAYKLNMNNVRHKQSRWLKIRNSRPAAKQQVVVQRLLPLQPGISQSYGLVTTQEEYLKNTIRSKDLNELIEDKKRNSKSLPNDKPITNYNNNNNNNNNNNATAAVVVVDHNNDDDNDNHDGDVDDGDKLKNEPESEPESEPDKKMMDNDTKCEIDSNEDNSLFKDISDDSLSDDPGIKSLLEISLPSPVSESNIDFICNGEPPMSPMGIIRESPTDPKWFEDNVNDFSLSSFLGHLDSACGIDNRKVPSNAETESSSNSNLSTINESSIDYMSKFVELAQSMKHQS